MQPAKGAKTKGKIILYIVGFNLKMLGTNSKVLTIKSHYNFLLNNHQKFFYLPTQLVTLPSSYISISFNHNSIAQTQA
jgi:hypothetical protein